MKNNVAKRLLELPTIIAEAENNLIAAQIALQKAKDALTDKEAELLLSGEINGKNAELRSAQLRKMTEAERAAVANAETELLKTRTKFNELINEAKCLRAVANILAGEVE